MVVCVGMCGGVYVEVCMWRCVSGGVCAEMCGGVCRYVWMCLCGGVYVEVC